VGLARGGQSALSGQQGGASGWNIAGSLGRMLEGWKGAAAGDRRMAGHWTGKKLRPPKYGCFG